MKHTTLFGRAFRSALLTSAVAAIAFPAFAQQQQAAKEEKLEEIVVTGSRIARPNDIATSPIAVVSFQELTSKSDITLEGYLNTLPQIAPSGTTTSNNPPNAGQANISLRGLGANRNLVLVDGRRPMVSASDQSVDVNTIPQALIESIEVVTGGAGATYGADAVSGVVNMKLKRNFEGANVSASYSNATGPWDAQEYQFQGLLGGNFAGDKGNAVLSFDYSKREKLIKGQRDFAGTASATTGRLPEGLYVLGGNLPTQAAIDTVFAKYGVGAGKVTNNLTLVGFNTDGTLFSRGVFNSPLDVQNFKYAIDSSINKNFYPDLYSYNFDVVNILVSPLNRHSFMGKTNYDITDNIEMFASVGWTRYSAASALAPTPLGTARYESPIGTDATRVKSALITPGRNVASSLIIPITNPFIPADLRTLLASRTGDNTAIVGSGATEPFQLQSRALWAGLRQNTYINEVVQYMTGLKGDITDSVRFEAYVSEGRTTIDQSQTGNVDGQKLATLLEAADGGASICAGGYNPFGRQAVSQACRDYLNGGAIRIANDFKQRIAQGFVSVDVAELPAGTMTVVAGAEHRAFSYQLRPGAASGPIHGFTTSVPAGGTNRFNDVFTETLIPLVKGAEYAKSLDLSLGYRLSNSKFNDTVNKVIGKSQNDSTYKAELTWQPLEILRGRASYQRAARAPNFGELFDGGGNAPQIFDPCSVTSAFRAGSAKATAAQALALCSATGLGAGASVFVQAPGGQASTDVSGNTALRAEKGDTISFGTVFNTGSKERWLERLNGSLDYYSIKIKDPILTVDPNLLIADCYNFFGNNSTYSATQTSCAGITPNRAPDILGIEDPSSADGTFPGRNAGKLQTNGIDLQLNYGFDLEWMGASSNAGALAFNLAATRVLHWKRQDLTRLPNIDYAGTVAFFGSLGGLDDGASMPKWRGTLNSTYSVSDVSLNVRTRYISGMQNRINVMFPGEKAKGVGAVWYFDVAAAWDVTPYASLRVGLNNATDRRPPTYTPNVQSGTDPSLYDVIGRRVFVQTNVKF